MGPRECNIENLDSWKLLFLRRRITIYVCLMGSGKDGSFSIDLTLTPGKTNEGVKLKKYICDTTFCNVLNLDLLSLN